MCSAIWEKGLTAEGPGPSTVGMAFTLLTHLEDKARL